MTLTIFAFSLFIFSFIAGLIGSLTGLGGGIIITPVLVLIFHLNIHLAMGASLISVIATSSGAASAYMRDGYTNLRVGLLLEVGAVFGALIGALLMAYVSSAFLMMLFSIVLIFSAYLTFAREEELDVALPSHPWATYLHLNGNFKENNKLHFYQVQRIPAGILTMSLAGLFSGLLGIGSGTLKVLAMDQILRLPYKVSTATSNFMIGITAAVSIGIYFSHGFINPIIAFPVMLGVLAGAMTGARLLSKIHTKKLRILFSVVIVIVAIEMMLKALGSL